MPVTVSLGREAVLHAVVSGGGAMLLAYAWFVWATDRASAPQVRGLAAAGAGFLMSAAASVYLRERPIAGPVVSLAGCALVISGMRMLLRDRLERQAAERRRGTGE
ncbi:hypothetical protein J421_4483 [Gemmatirosa kalamazoonensis]|jgi:hypothetical protein|uniref:Transmembrane protein n=1 Tax=Gemmatirosa kalamazoonensis TaxID=861299 RepID=W0RNU6_9BACT|nr:hypothetical protein [Gemmatirosa kalamazoonensis]AHG92020.1 hypothetical protein J421_4483 [Gemmatirosa kalamazoonensis]